MAILDAGKWGDDDVAQPLWLASKRAGHLLDPSGVDLSHHHPVYRPLVLHTQGPGILLAGLWTLTGDRDYGYLSVVQIAIASLLTLAVFWTTTTLFKRRRAGYIAAGLYAVYPPLAEFSRYTFYDPWTVFFAIALLALFVKALQPDSGRRWLVALGVCAGLGMNFRFQLVLLLPALALASLPIRGWRWSGSALAIALAASLPFVLPWTIRNAVDFHAFVPVHTGFGQVMWQGFGERADNPFHVVDDDGITYREVQRRRPDLKYATPAYDSYLAHRALDGVTDHPAFYTKLVAARVVDSTVSLRNPFWEGSKRQTRYLRKTDSEISWDLKHPLDRAILLLAHWLEPATVVAGLLTLMLTWRRFRREHLLLIAAIVALIITSVVINFNWRYVAASEMVWIILAGLGADELINRLARARNQGESPGDRERTRRHGQWESNAVTTRQ